MLSFYSIIIFYINIFLTVIYYFTYTHISSLLIITIIEKMIILELVLVR